MAEMITHRLRTWQGADGTLPTLCLMWTQEYGHEIACPDKLPTCEECREIDACPSCRQSDFGRLTGPRHKASCRCQSGGRPHCTCDTCF